VTIASRKRVVLGWEFGGGLGHLMRLRPIASNLLTLGCEVFLIAASGRDAAHVFWDHRNDAKFTLLQAPALKRDVKQNTGSIPTVSLADVLVRQRLDQADILFALADTWFALLRDIQPDLVVSDFSPCLNLVTRGITPTVVIGNGYTIPPNHRRLPPIAPWVTELPDGSAEHEKKILRAANTILDANRRPRLNFLGELFHGDRTFICSFGEFDPYRRFPPRSYATPFNIPLFRASVPISNRPENCMFVYLPGDHPGLPMVAGIASALRLDCTVYAPNISDSAKANLEDQGHRVLREPANLGEVLQRSRLILHHGGLAVTHAALLSGTPQVLLPINLEQEITARGLEPFGACAAFFGGSKVPMQNVLEACRMLLANPDAAITAVRNSHALLAGRPQKGCAGVVEECLSLLSSSPREPNSFCEGTPS
jgi:rhamnosyltransferase subunit B